MTRNTGWHIKREPQATMTETGVTYSQGSAATCLRCGGVCNDDYHKFTAKSHSERILKIRQYFAKLCAKLKWYLFNWRWPIAQFLCQPVKWDYLVSFCISISINNVVLVKLNKQMNEFLKHWCNALLVLVTKTKSLSLVLYFTTINLKEINIYKKRIS